MKRGTGWLTHICATRPQWLLYTICHVYFQRIRGWWNSKTRLSTIRASMLTLQMGWYVSAGTSRRRTPTLTRTQANSLMQHLERQAITVGDWKTHGPGVIQCHPLCAGIFAGYWTYCVTHVSIHCNFNDISIIYLFDNQGHMNNYTVI